MIIELANVLQVDTPFGRGRVLFYESGGPDGDSIWHVVLPTGVVVCVRNREVRVAPNWTLGVRRDEAEGAIKSAIAKDAQRPAASRVSVE